MVLFGLPFDAKGWVRKLIIELLPGEVIFVKLSPKRMLSIACPLIIISERIA
jgi:hypothetical protein